MNRDWLILADAAAPEDAAAAQGLLAKRTTPGFCSAMTTATPLPAIRVILSSASVRSGPGIHYDTIGFMLEGETAVVIARNNGPDTWYNIILESGLRGWISGTVVESGTENDLADVPLAATIPAPPTPTNTPVPTQTPFPTPTPFEDNGGGGSNNPPGPQATSTQPPLP